MRRYICLLFIGLIVGIEKISAEGNLTPAADGWYEVRTPEELCWISEWVNSGNTRINVRLMNDLDMRSIENFTPIGMYTDTGGLPSRSFQGIFDGQKHVIYNLNVYREDTYECGLFSRINGGGILQRSPQITFRTQRSRLCGGGPARDGSSRLPASVEEQGGREGGAGCRDGRAGAGPRFHPGGPRVSLWLQLRSLSGVRYGQENVDAFAGAGDWRGSCGLGEPAAGIRFQERV